jgi:acetyl esterase/lipase
MIHGGGWRTGDKATWAEEANRLAERGWVAFSINYRLDEPSLFPAEVDDVQTAVRWVRSHAREYGIDTTRVGALGESAGGHLAAMLATLGSGPLDAGARIRVGAAWSPPTDLSALARSRGDQWATSVMGCTLSTCADKLAQASPVTHVDGGDAPLYLVNSSDEQIPLSQAQALNDRLGAAAVDHQLDVLPGSRHALDYRRDAWAPTLAFLDKYLGAAPVPADDSSSSPGAVVAAVAIVVILVAAAGFGVRRVLRQRRR